MKAHPSDISVVIPAFNNAAMIGRSINSVLSQTLPPREVIVVDDGSTDDTPAKVAEFGKQVRYIRQANAGPGAARNRGIDAARGSWIAFQDADDIWLPDRLSRCVAILRKEPSLVWCCATLKQVWPDGTEAHSDPAQWEHLWNENRTAMDFLQGRAHGVPVGIQGMLVRRDVLEETGKFAPDLLSSEDTDLFIRIALRHPMIGVAWPPQVRYVQTEGSVTRTVGRDHSDAMVLFIERVAALRDEASDAAWAVLRERLARKAHTGILHACLMGRRDCLHRLLFEFGWLVSPRDRLLGSLALLFPSPMVAALAGGVKAWGHLRYPNGYAYTIARRASCKLQTEAIAAPSHP